MSRDANPLLEGTVIGEQRTHFEVKLDDGVTIVKCRLSGNMRRNFIKVTVNDRVQVRVGSYDLNNGFIVYRYK